MARPSGRPASSPYVPLGLGVACVSLGSIFVRMAEASPLAVAFHRVFLASLFLAPFATAPLVRSWRTVPRRSRMALVASGVALALHFATWTFSLSYTSVASSVLLVNTAPVFTLGLSWVFLGETVPPLVVGAILAALAGAALIAAGDWTGAAHSLTGAALAVTGAVTLSLYHVIGRGLRRALPLEAYVLAVWSIAALTLAALGVCTRASLFGQPPRALVWLLALALIPTLAGHGLVNLSLRALPAPTVGLFLLGEPVAATALAYLVFGETPGIWTLSGGLVVLAALATVIGGTR